MSFEHVIKQGLDLKMSGKPATTITEVSAPEKVTIYPQEITGIKPRLVVKEGEMVSRNGVLFYDKRNEAMKFRSPVAGKLVKVVFGARRSLQELVIDTSVGGGHEELRRFGLDELSEASREDVLGALADSGLLALIKQRPFSTPASPDQTPKSIFINGMCNAAFRADIHVAVKGKEEAFQAGVNALTRLTDGAVNLCISRNSDAPAKAVTNAFGVKLHYFSGPHPSGNTSTHIHAIDPIAPGDVVWAVPAVALLQIGEFLLSGLVPDRKIIVAGGEGLKEEGRHYYNVPVGAPLSSVLGDQLVDGETRIVGGDVFAGDVLSLEGSIRLMDTSITVLAEDRSRHFMGWLAPGLNKFSVCRAFVSAWTGRKREWSLGTSRNGSLRAMVLTGTFDKYVPLNIMVDFLVRACIARDTDEAIALGILETDPEDFALCNVACASKTDFSALVERMLKQIETEGF